ncbi:MAG TPA: hypothetical protein VL651_03590 [Bacteroidia bacterium]|jgi:hypothetical protein|nr:hypothetical protein [Bacteroidia bacterium]
MRRFLNIAFTCTTTYCLLGCSPSSITDEVQNEDINQAIYKEPAVCPVRIDQYRGYRNQDSTLSVDYSLHNLTNTRIMSVTIRTYVTKDFILDNVWKVASESAFSDTTLATKYFTEMNDQHLHYELPGIGKTEGTSFFFEVRDVTFFGDSLIKGSGWFQYETIKTGGGQ